MSESQPEVLERILQNLKSDDATDQLAAIRELSRISYSSPAVMLELERLALRGSKSVRQASLNALDSKVSQYIRTQTLKHLRPDERFAILAELEDWQKQGLIRPEQAEVLVRRYDFNRKPIEPAAETAVRVETQPAAPAVVEREAAIPKVEETKAAEPAAPRLTLSQRLLSQTSINIALYLGAFLVIGAAVILAALVEVTRLPILLGITILFAGSSVAIKRRLPQPSFVLFIVFSFLLPINGSVIAQTFHLTGQVANAYWAGVFFTMALIWGISTWFYSSRLFSIASFIALVIAFLKFGSIFLLATEWNIFDMTLVSLIGLLGVHVLKGWKDSRFGLPLFLTAQIVNGLTLSSSFGLAVFNALENQAGSGIWTAIALTWISAASFYAWSGLLFTFPLFPWGAVASLLPVSWLALKALNAPDNVQIIGLWVWGTAFASVSEFAQRKATKYFMEYFPPLFLGSIPLYLAAWLWGWAEDISYAFGVLLGAAVIFTLLMTLRPRAYVWLIALLFGTASYFTFFGLPFIKTSHIYSGYQLLGSSILLLAPELFFKPPLTSKDAWRWPALMLGALITLINVISVLSVPFSDMATAIVMGAYALLFAALAIHFRKAGTGYLATASAAVSAIYALKHFHAASDMRLEILTGLSLLYFVAGYLLRMEKTRAWGSMLRISGLALGAVISLTALFITSNISGWYLLAVGFIFFAETYIRSEDRIEASGPFFTSLAVFITLRKLGITDLPIHLLMLSLIWLGADLVFSRTLKQRRLANLARVVGGVMALWNLPSLVNYAYQAGHAGQAAIFFGIYALFFAADAWLYKRAVIGYSSTVPLAFAVLTGLEYFQHGELWLPALTGLSVLYFAAGYLLRNDKGRAWGTMFRISGLAAGAVLSLAALITLESSGEWYVLIVGAMFLIETYLRREDRLEISAPFFFSIAAFLGLHQLKISEFPYHLLVISVIWLGADLLYARTFEWRRFAFVTRSAGGVIALGNGLVLITSLAGDQPAAICFGAYAIFFTIYAWVYQKPRLGYLATAALPLSVFFELQAIHQENWLYATIAIAILYYAAGFILRRSANASSGWHQVLLLSGLGLGVINSLSAPLQVGLDAAIPVALAATLFAAEAFARRNVWLGLPANLLYLESYFLILIWLNVHEPQYFSIGAALLGMLMHYLLTRAGSKTGAFIMGLVSQLVLVGTTYIQMVALLKLSFFFVLFFQSLAVLIYGIVMRSRSLVIAPVSFVVLGVLTVVFYALKNLSLVVIIGITGIALLVLGILAAVMRERITTLAERFRDWQA